MKIQELILTTMAICFCAVLIAGTIYVIINIIISLIKRR